MRATLALAHGKFCRCGINCRSNGQTLEAKASDGRDFAMARGLLNPSCIF
jgi:hypothetical protein